MPDWIYPDEEVELPESPESEQALAARRVSGEARFVPCRRLPPPVEDEPAADEQWEQKAPGARPCWADGCLAVGETPCSLSG